MSGDITNLFRRFTAASKAEHRIAMEFVGIPPIERCREVIRKYLNDAEAYRVDILSKVSTFGSLTHDALRTGAQCMEDMSLRRGDVVINQDDIGDSFFIVEIGKLVATKKNDVNDPDEEPRVIGYLSNDNYFGELALLTEEPRSATITVLSETAKILRMTRETFTQIVNQSNLLSANSRDKIGHNVLNTIPFIKGQTMAVKKSVLLAMQTIKFTSNISVLIIVWKSKH